MPKDDVDSEDPMELVGVSCGTVDERAMTVALVDEYIRMGFDRAQIWSLFEDPFYSATHTVLLRRGRDWVAAAIDEAVNQWCPQSAGATGPRS